MTNKLYCDVAIIGGGIAGLWLLNRLKLQGLNPILLENHTLGGSQTIYSQGIIHGGLKYALQGVLNKSATAMQQMPEVWKKCLENKGQIDLSGVNILATSQLLWSSEKLVDRMTGFFASKLLRSNIKPLKSNLPPPFDSKYFRGQVYQIDEVILDVQSLVAKLVENHLGNCVKVDKISSQTNNKSIEYLKFTNENQSYQLYAKKYVFTAGKGNIELTKDLFEQTPMQLRPLHMVTLQQEKLPRLYAHCIGKNQTPRITITTHYNANKQMIWYLGGQIAEDGVNRSDFEQIEYTKHEIATLIPWLDLTNAEYRNFRIDRAEGLTLTGEKPDSITIHAINNAIISWPTKLALAPLLSDKIIDNLEDIQPVTTRHNLAPPSICKPIWEQ